MTGAITQDSTASSRRAAPAQPVPPAGANRADKDEKEATSIVDPLLPSWEPARTVGQTAILLGEILVCLVLLVVIGNILHRVVYFAFEFLGRGKWKESPRDLRISVGKEGLLIETLQQAQVAKAPLREQEIRELVHRVDNLEGDHDTLVQTVNGLIDVETEQVLESVGLGDEAAAPASEVASEEGEEIR